MFPNKQQGICVPCPSLQYESTEYLPFFSIIFTRRLTKRFQNPQKKMDSKHPPQNNIPVVLQFPMVFVTPVSHDFHLAAGSLTVFGGQQSENTLTSSLEELDEAAANRREDLALERAAQARAASRKRGA